VRGMRGKDERRVNRARSLRRAFTPAERKLWANLRNGQLGGFKFTRQEPIGKYYADFACRDRRVILEVDGGQHAESVPDRQRDNDLAALGYRVIRIWNNDVIGNIAGVLEMLLSEPSAIAPAIAPHPDPLPASGARELFLAQHAVEGADGVVGAGVLFGFGRGKVGVEAGDSGIDVARRRVLFEKG
jgi:very-short-patch-repair endonuclease